MRKYAALGTLAFLGIGAPAFAAEGFSYNLLEGGYVSTELDDFDLDGDGLVVGGSFELSEHVFGFGSINDIDYDFGISTSAVSLGLGFNWALAPNVDLVSGVSYERVKVKVSGAGSESESGIGLNVGLRGRVGESLELSGGLKYADFGDDVNDFTFGAGGRYYFTPAFAAGIDFSNNDDGNTWTVALRYDFGSRL